MAGGPVVSGESRISSRVYTGGSLSIDYKGHCGSEENRHNPLPRHLHGPSNPIADMLNYDVMQPVNRETVLGLDYPRTLCRNIGTSAGHSSALARSPARIQPIS